MTRKKIVIKKKETEAFHIIIVLLLASVLFIGSISLFMKFDELAEKINNVQYKKIEVPVETIKINPFNDVFVIIIPNGYTIRDKNLSDLQNLVGPSNVETYYVPNYVYYDILTMLLGTEINQPVIPIILDYSGPVKIRHIFIGEISIPFIEKQMEINTQFPNIFMKNLEIRKKPAQWWFLAYTYNPFKENSPSISKGY